MIRISRGRRVSACAACFACSLISLPASAAERVSGTVRTAWRRTCERDSPDLGGLRRVRRIHRVAMRTRWNVGAAALVALVCATTATAVAPPRTDPKIAAEVPAKIRAKGTLLVATAATYAPNEFIRPGGHVIVGMDADLARALAAVMGLRAKMVDVRFDTIIPGLASGRYDVGMSSIT